MSGKLKSSAALAILVAIATVSAPSTAYLLRPVIAQVTDAPAFPAPAEVPSGTEVRINGSRTMEQINTTLAERFETQFSGTTVDVAYDGTDTALQAVLNGEVDLAAIGRSLTEQERAQGLVEVAVARHKIAVITAANSPFNGSLTVDQFAQIFRGEVTDWSQVGGAPGAIRLVDRPEESETRQAFQRYPSFQTAPFTTGANAEQVGEDSTQAVLANLGTDGVGYAIADQVTGNAGVRIVPMHDVLPDDPRYPFSQPLNYVYREAANPAVQAFLGYATAPETQSAVEEARSADAVAVLPFVAPAPAPEAPSPEAEAPAPAEPAPEAEAPAATDNNATTPAATDPNAEPTPATTTDSDAATATRRTTFPWWLLLLFPILGGLLWWLLRDDRGSATGVAAAPTGTVAPPVGILPGTEGSRIILTPRTCKDAYAYWEVPDGVFDRLEDEGGRELVLRLYDVTDLDLDRQDPHSVKEFTCDPTDSDRHVPIAVDDRDYIAELGYVTPEGNWLRIARSDYVRVPACDSDIWNEVSTRETSVHTSVQDTGRMSAVAGTPPTTHPASIDQPTTPQAGGTLGQVALGAAGIAAVGAASQAVTRPPVSPTQESRVMFVPRSANDAYAYWELSEERKAALRKLGGRKLSLRVYDVTDIDMTTQPVHSVRQYDCDEQTADLHIPIYEADRDYIAELGYIADDGRWLRVARSETVRFPSSLDATRTVQTPETPVRGVNTRADGDRSDTVKPGTANPGTANPSTVNPLKGGGTSAGIVGAAGATETAARMVSDSATRAIPDRDRTDRPMAPERGVGSQPTGSPPVSGVTASGDTGSRVTASGITATPARSPVEVVRRIILVPRTPESAYAYWEVSDSAKVEAKRQGGTQFMLRVHDATGIDIDHQLPHSTQEYRCAEEEQDKHISIPASDRDYIAEIGYYTDDHRWLRIIRSFHVSVPSDPALF